MINENIGKGNWREVKGKIRSAWGKLTDDELEEAKGDITRIGGLIQRKYGTAQEEVRKKLNDFFSGKKDEDQDSEKRDSA